MTGRKRKIGTLTIRTEVIDRIENSRLDASAKRLAEYFHDKVSDKCIDPSNSRFGDLSEPDDI